MTSELPLIGLKVLELAGIGPGPFAGMMLADAGADVIVVDRPGGNPSASRGHDILLRNRRSIAIDLKQPAGVDVLLAMLDGCDALIEPFRPGVAERLGIGPDRCLSRNPRLVYGRITGWGQGGPLRLAAGHDLNYIALTGALHSIGRAGAPPSIPLNLIGDFGGGGMMLAFGIVAGVLSARMTGRGRVVDAAMVDGASALMAMFHGLRADGSFDDERGTHELDGGAPFYDVYETADGRYVSIGALEPAFFATLCERLDLPPDIRSAHDDRKRWPILREAIALAIHGRTREELDALLLGTDACYAPVLTLSEAADHPHNVHRHAFLSAAGGVQPAPAPRFGEGPPAQPVPRRPVGADTRGVLAEAGVDESVVDGLIASGVVQQAALIPPDDMNPTQREK